MNEEDEITIDYDSHFSDGRVQKDVTIISVMSMMSWDDHRGFRAKEDDGNELYITSCRHIWTCEEREAGIVTKQKREIGEDVEVL